MELFRNRFLWVCVCVLLLHGVLSAKEGLSCELQPHTVMVILEAKCGEEERLKNALLKVAKRSRLEDSCLEYRFYQDSENQQRFGLYEQWKSKELHLLQFSKPYIADFVRETEGVLEKPYEAIFGEEV